MTQPVLTFEMQKTFWKLLREYGDSCADVAVNGGKVSEKQREKARKGHEKARDELSAFVESITEKPRQV